MVEAAVASDDELREEGSWSSRTGWLVTQVLRPTAPGATEEEEGEARPATKIPRPAVELRLVRVLLFCSGRSYPEDLERALQRLA